MDIKLTTNSIKNFSYKAVMYFILLTLAFPGLPSFSNGLIKKAKAETATFSGLATSYVNLDKTHDNKDIVIDGAKVVMDGSHSFNSLTIRNGGELTHSAPDIMNTIPVTNDYFTVRWKGFIQTPNDRRGLTRLSIDTDGPTRLIITGTTSSGNPGYRSIRGSWSSGYTGKLSTAALNPGAMYGVEIWFHEQTGGMNFKMYWEKTIYSSDVNFTSISERPVVYGGIGDGGELYLKEDKTSTNICGGGSKYESRGLCGEYFFPHSWDGSIPGQFGTPLQTPTVTQVNKGKAQYFSGLEINFPQWPTYSDSYIYPFEYSLGEDDSLIRAAAQPLQLNIATNLSLESGGKINLNGRGYAGGYGAIKSLTEGFRYKLTGGHGAGGGKASDNIFLEDFGKDDISGGGGGFGAIGGIGCCNGAFKTDGGQTYGTQGQPQTYSNLIDSSLSILRADSRLGSGGAGGMHKFGSSYREVSTWYGGRGGGGLVMVVNGQLSIGANSTITADGETGRSQYNLTEATSRGVGASGSGSGGLIYIKAPKIINAAGGAPLGSSNYYNAPLVTGGVVGLNGTLWNVSANNDILRGFGANITAKGGAVNGAGGRISIDTIIEKVTANLSANPLRISENNGESSLEVTLDKPAPVGGLIINLSVDSDPAKTTAAATDYELIGGAVSIAEGLQSGKANLRAKDNTNRDDGDRTVTIGIQPTDQIILGTQPEQKITIFNDDFLTCMHQNPTLVFTRQMTTSVPPGGSFVYELTLTNNDNGVCSPSNFTLNQVFAGTGWSGVFPGGFTSIKSLSPSKAFKFNMTVNSPVGLTDGEYPVKVTAQNESLPSFSGSATAAFKILANNSDGSVSAPSQVTVKVKWLEFGQEKTLELSSFLSQLLP